MTAIPTRSTKQRWWPLARRILSFAFFSAVAVFLVIEAREVDWHKVHAALHATPAATLGIAAGLGIASHLLFSTFDVAGRFYVRSRLPIALVMTVNFISYAFNLSFGTIVGGVALRYRLYTRLGLTVGDVTRIMSLSIITNWIGHVLLAGLLLIRPPLPLPREWALPAWSLRGLGIALTAIAIAYVVLCAISRRREWNLRGRRIALPSARMALLQLSMSCANWLLMCALVYVLLQQRIGFDAVAFALLVAAIAGVVMHIPAGLGVTEGVFIAMLGNMDAKEHLLAALLLYRFIYYLMPLALATLLYIALETHARKNDK